MRTIDEIIIHCTATEDGVSYTASDIDRWHKANGWQGIGYHFVVLLDGTVEAGRSVAAVGAHCKGHNQRSIGVCYVGGLRNGKPADTRTPEQRKALRNLVATLRHCYPAIAKVSGHNDYAAKACPCFNVKTDL